MISIQIFVLQTPKILIDGVPALLPYQKAEALLYYLAIEKKATRDRAAALLWDNCGDVTAKKNLRHAIYTIKKALGTELVVSADRHMLTLNPTLTIYTDYDEFIKMQQLSVYKGELLKDYYIKNAAAFYDWLAVERRRMSDTYLKLLYQQLHSFSSQDPDMAEKLFHAYVEEDALDESVYRIMMEIYEKNGLYYKGIKLYQGFEKLIKKELDTSPGKEIRILYKRLLYSLGEFSDEVPPGLIGREDEIALLTEHFNRFLDGRPSALLLTGESGSGKTYLAEYLLRLVGSKPCLILKAACLETEQTILLQPWNTILTELQHLIQSRELSPGNEYTEAVSSLFPLFDALHIPQLYEENFSVFYSCRTTCDLLMKLFSSLSRQIPVLLFFDSVNHMDPMSLTLASRLICAQYPNVMFFGTCPHTHFDSPKHSLSSLVKEKKLIEHVVTAVGNHAGALLGPAPGSSFRKLSLDKLAKLSHPAKQVLSLLSACQTNADLQLFEDLLGQDPLTLLDILEDLKEQDILYERVDGKNIYFAFRNNSIRKLVYEEMSPSRRRFFHEKLAEHLLSLDSFETRDYNCLIYHYTQSGNEALELKYQILLLEEYTKRYYELYPMQYSYSKGRGNDIPSFADRCDELETRLLSLNSPEPDNMINPAAGSGIFNPLGSRHMDPQVRPSGSLISGINVPRLYISLLRTKAQYCVAKGDYEKGLDSVRKALKINRETGSDPLIYIRCLRLINFYRLNIWKIGDLQASLSECLQIGEVNHFDEDFAIDCRLYGLYAAMQGDYKSSLRFLRRSLRVFSGFTMKSRVYMLHIAACYNYMGETYRKQEQFEKAIGLYHKAIDLCGDITSSGNAVFYSNLGRAYLALGRAAESAAAFYTSEQLYNDSAALIGRSITKGYVSILEAEKGCFPAAARLLLEAADSAAQLASPHSLGLLSLTRYTLSSRYPGQFREILPKSAEDYKKEALRCLKDIPGMYEITYF